MSLAIQIILICFVLFIGWVIIMTIKSGRLSVRYAMVWLGSVFFMLIALIIPNLLLKVANLLGFQVVSNMLFLVGILILLVIVFSLSVIVSGQERKIKMLIQELSILKKKVNKEKKK
jgi:hypothetical protein